MCAKRRFILVRSGTSLLSTWQWLICFPVLSDYNVEKGKTTHFSGAFEKGLGWEKNLKKYKKTRNTNLTVAFFQGVVAYQDRHLQTTVKEVFGFLNFNDVTHLPTCAQRDWIQVGLIWKCPNITFEEPSRSWLPSSGGKL